MNQEQILQQLAQDYFDVLDKCKITEKEMFEMELECGFGPEDYKCDKRLDSLPKRDRMHLRDYDYYDHYPKHWKRVHRFLMSNVGQDWDTVISKYTKLPWVPAQYRTFKHLSTIVEVHTFIKDDEVYYLCKYNARNTPLNRPVTERTPEILYVHPDTNALCYLDNRVSKRKRRAIREAEESKTLKILAPYSQIQKIDGIWYYGRVEDLKTAKKRWRPTDRLWRNTYAFDSPWYGEPEIYKQQLNRKELKKHNLKND